MKNSLDSLSCCPGLCREAKREDRRAGLIYGPYEVGRRRAPVSGFYFSAILGRCSYCGTRLPAPTSRVLRDRVAARCRSYARRGLPRSYGCA